MLRKKLHIISLYYFVFITFCVVLTSLIFRIIGGEEVLVTFESIQSALIVGGIHGVCFFFVLPFSKRKFVTRMEQCRWENEESKEVEHACFASNLDVNVLHDLVKEHYAVVSLDKKNGKMSFLLQDSIKSLGYGAIAETDTTNQKITIQVSSSKLMKRKNNSNVLHQIIQFVKTEEKEFCKN